MFQKTLLQVVFCFIAVFGIVSPQYSAYAESGGMVTDCIDQADNKGCTENTTSSKEKNDGDTNDVGISAWQYAKVILALIFVVALLYFVLKVINKNNTKYQQSKMMQNLGGLSLGQQKSVQLLKVGNTLYLIGVGDDVNILKEISDEQEQAALIKMYDDKQQLASSTPYIAELIKKFTQKNTPQQQTAEQPDFKQQFDEKLKEMKKNRQKDLNEWKEKETKKDE